VRTFVKFHELVASRALCIFQTNGIGVRVCWLLGLGAETEAKVVLGKPFLLYFSLQAIKVKDMLTAKLNNCFFT
jgi:hypothetical protein